MKNIVKYLRKAVPETHFLRLLYHKIMAVIAAFYYRFPSEVLTVIAVTGTKGKTTTTNLITNILSFAGEKVGMTSTANFQIGDKKWINDLKQTTLSPFKLQGLLRQMVNEGCKYAVLETSSHSFTQSRIWGINIDVGVFTNITPEHIEYHGNFNNYLNAKGGIFKQVTRGKRKFGVEKTLIMNADDPYFTYFNQFVSDRKVSFGLKTGNVTATDIQRLPDCSRFVLQVPNNSMSVKLNLPGDFNILNSLAAVSVCIGLNISVEKIKEGLEKSSTIQGRFEHVEQGQGYSIIVDYAHTAESLENLLALYKGLTTGKLFVVFGATGGGRDKAKRPKMGNAADKYADYVIVTDDDPYEEDEWQIIDQVSAGITRKEGANFWKIPDRREAIRLALTLAKEGDCVVVAGKGSEELMMVRGKTIKWNDKHVIKELLGRKIEVEILPNKFEERENVCFQS